MARKSAQKKVARPNRRGPHAMDVHVGHRLRLRRTLLGMSQESLGDAIGLTFQQIQKYERGTNRIGASRLHQFSLVLDVSISYFYEEAPDSVTSAPPGMLAEDAPAYQPNPMARRETIELVRAYYRIQDPGVRQHLFDLVKASSLALGKG